jgi:hypothetical protein
MGWIVGKGIGIPFRLGGTGINSSYWTTQSHFYELWKVTGAGNLIGLKRGDILTVTGSGLNATYAVPDTLAYKTIDTDYVFHKSDGSVSTACDGNRLISYDFPRVIVKYGDVTPYAIEYVGILDTGQSVNNKMRDDFHLSVWWDNTLSFHGNEKANRLVGKSVWDTIPVVPTGLALSLISGGVKIDWVNESQGITEIWGQSDGAEYTLLYEINEGIATKNDTGVVPVDLRYYKLRATKEGNVSEYTNPVSIAMLSAEIITNGGFDDASAWSLGNPWSLGSGKCTYDDASNGTMYQTGNLQLHTGDVIRQKFSISNGGTTDMMVTNSAGHAWTGSRITVGNGDHTIFETLTYNPIAIGLTIGYRAFTSGNGFAIDNLSIKKVLIP